MPIYKYNGIKKNNRRISSTISATDPDDLKVRLREQDVFLVKYSILKEHRKSDFLAISSKVKTDEFVTFCQQFSIMLKAGISITDCLDTLRNQPFGTVFKNVISDVYEDVLKGVLLSDAFRKHPKVFPDFYCSMIKVGEIAGNLVEVLNRTSSYYEQDQRTKKKTKTAMIYPTFLSIMILAVVILLMVFVVPQFNSYISQGGGEVPLITQIVMAISSFFVDNIVIILVVLAVIALGIFLGLRTKKGQYIKDWMAFHMPVLRSVVRAQMTARFSTSFSILLASGMPIVDCMEALEDVLENQLFAQKFRYAIDEVKRGKRISRSIENTDLFPVMLTQMISVGEESSTLEEVLNNVGDYYTGQLNIAVAKATAVLEPLIIVILGIIVGIVILAVMLPMISMMNSIGGTTSSVTI